MDPLVTGIKERWDGQGLRGDPGPFMAICAVARLNQLLRKALDEELGRFDLGRTGYAVLTTLALIDSGQAGLSTLGRWLMVHPTTVTLTVDQLRADGLVDRVPHPRDRRAALVQITAKGRERVNEANLALEAPGGPLAGLAGDGHGRLFEALQAARVAVGDLEFFGDADGGDPHGAAQP
ncbi:MarR family winged helix-turn-helix transcriptional regulator [Actinomadura sediminis]|uniref:MarR family winged helix-turn-helix transcriptional regulator n=1 Tax=Actinomadura sediminis TaxID=1038904 RepID=A0ABW3ER36_9ACTN